LKLSIITINLNNAEELRKTIQSVIEQSWKEYEFLVIDGGSEDGSIEIIREYANYITYWSSEKDNGVFNAMNKGIAHSKGEYLLMLNSGDVLYNKDVLHTVFVENSISEDLIYGNVLRESKGAIIDTSFFPESLTFQFFRNGSLSHQGTFINQRIHTLLGLYDETLKFSADWKFLILAVCKHNFTYKHLPFLITICNCDGLTCNPRNFAAMKQEVTATLELHFPSFLEDYKKLDTLKQRTINSQIKIYKAVAKTFTKRILKR
jgi:glycosyltransferase involved in cell wall biosynthesis